MNRKAISVLFIVGLFVSSTQYAESMPWKQKVKNVVSWITKNIPSKKTCIIALSTAALCHCFMFRFYNPFKNDQKNMTTSDSTTITSNIDHTTDKITVIYNSKEEKDLALNLKQVSTEILLDTIVSLAPIRTVCQVLVKKQHCEPLKTTQPIIYTLENDDNIQAKFVIFVQKGFATIMASSLRTVDEKYNCTDRYSYHHSKTFYDDIRHEVFHQQLYETMIQDLKNHGCLQIIHNAPSLNNDYWVARGFPKIDNL